MKIIVGLGNPGDRYNFTRHNLGFLALDFWAKTEDWEWRKEKWGAEYVELPEKAGFLLKAQTFYNDTGEAVRRWADFYKVKAEDILVVGDDFQIEFGKVRWRERGTDGGNNGLKSVQKMLGTTDFPRLRIGTANDELRRKMGDTEFVLGRFSEEEKARLGEVLMEAKKRMGEFVGV